MKKLYQYPLSCIVQLLLCKIGIACHNPFRDECTPDFECCAPYSKKYWLHISGRRLPLKVTTAHLPTAPKGTEGRTFLKIKTLYIFNKRIISYTKKL